MQNTSTDANWTVCDGLNAPSRGGADGVGVTVIAGPLEDTGARAAALGPGQAVLVDSGAGTWLLWDGKRSPIDLADHAVTSGLGLGADVPRRGSSPRGCSTRYPKHRH